MVGLKADQFVPNYFAVQNYVPNFLDAYFNFVDIVFDGSIPSFRYYLIVYRKVIGEIKVNDAYWVPPPPPTHPPTP